MTGPEQRDIIGTDDPRATFEDFVEGAADRLMTAALTVTGGDRDAALDLLAGVLARASRRWWWISRPGRDPEWQVLAMLLRAAGRDPADAGHLAAQAGRPHPADPGAGPDAEPPVVDPRAARLLAAVRQRRGGQRTRLAVACGVAAVLVLAAVAWPVSNALRGGPRTAAPQPGVSASSSPLISAVSGLGSVPGPAPLGPPVHRAPGTVLRNCETTDGGQLSRHWRADSLRAGPVWFIFAKPPGIWLMRQHERHGHLPAGAAAIAIQASRRAVVRVVGPARARFHFLPGFTTSNSYTWRDGRPGITLGGCPGEMTIFWQGYITTLKCVPMVEQPLPRGGPVRFTLSATHHPCR